MHLSKPLQKKFAVIRYGHTLNNMRAAFHSFCYFNKLFQLLGFCGMGRYAVVAMSLLRQLRRSKNVPECKFRLLLERSSILCSPSAISSLPKGANASLLAMSAAYRSAGCSSLYRKKVRDLSALSIALARYAEMRGESWIFESCVCE